MQSVNYLIDITDIDVITVYFSEYLFVKKKKNEINDYLTIQIYIYIYTNKSYYKYANSTLVTIVSQ